MFDQVGEGVFRRRYPSLDLNIRVVFGDDGVLLVDTRATGAQATELREELGSSTDLPVRWVVNTHWHWDHTFGNARFRGCRIWGHELCRVALEDRSEEMRREAKDALGAEFDADIDATEIQPPTEVFSDSISIDIGRIVELSYHGLAHTDSDIVVGVPDAGVVFLGDLSKRERPLPSATAIRSPGR